MVGNPRLDAPARDETGNLKDVICPFGRLADGDLNCKAEGCMAFVTETSMGIETVDCRALRPEERR